MRLQHFQSELQPLGFELLDDTRKQQIDKIKSIVIDHIHYKEDEKFIFTEVQSKALHKEYSIISRLFYETEEITIQQYVNRIYKFFLGLNSSCFFTININSCVEK